MSATLELDKYLQAYGSRLKRVCLWRGGAVLAAVVLAVCLGAAYYAIDTGFADAVVITGRLALLAVIAAGAWWLILKPGRRLGSRAAAVIERRTRAFGGRVLTYTEMRDPANPFRELLAEDTLKISADYPVERQVRTGEYTVPGVVAGACAALLLGLIIAGPGLLNYSLRHLLAGWAVAGLLPPQTIAVTPGDELVRRGGNVQVRAVMSGFEPDRAEVHVKIGGKEWQTVAMVRRPEGFEFTFFSVREPLQYYVAGAGIRSPEYEIQVVDLPDVRNLRLTYRYPDWTRRAPETLEHGGDIRAVAGTGIDLEVITEQPLPGGLLVLNGAGRPLAGAGVSARAGFEISEDGQYFIAARLGGEQVRLTDDYFIKVVEDAKPEIKLDRPGRDWNASNIEEVTARVEAQDDYALEALELRYSINGGNWQSVPLPFEERETGVDHVFFLEHMRSAGDKPLAPGDLIAYYAEAQDRLHGVQTDMFFIEVQQFDRRYTQSQLMGGGGGALGNPQQEISQRQKEIIVSTWNLIRAQSGQQSDAAALTARDNATLLSGLQQTLAEQAQTLADRLRARELATVDEHIKTFVENLEQAVAAMHPAAEHLAANDLRAAIQPEQEALQHLLRAESVFNDIQVSFQRGQDGRGFQAGRDLAEMFELEMDLEKNQYETGSSAFRRSPVEEVDDAMRKLEELARRQEQLAEDLQRQRQLTAAQRWRQELLRRDAEALRRQLEQWQRRQTAGGQSGPGLSSEPGSGGDDELSRRLDSAIRAMNEAADAMRGDRNNEQLQQALQEARRQLQRARNQVAEDQRLSMERQFQDMAERATDLHRRQERMDAALQNAVRQALALRREDEDRIVNPMSYDEETALAERKRALQEELQALRQAMQTAAGNYKEQAPEAVRKLEQANAELRDAEIDARLGIAASYIDQGTGLYIAGSESVVTNALRNLEISLEQAQSLIRGLDRPGASNLERVLAQTRSLRRELQELTIGNSEQAAQDDAGAGQPGRENAGDSGRAGGFRAGGRFGDRYGYGGWDDWSRPYGVIRPEYWDRIVNEINVTAGGVNPIIPELRDRGLSEEEIDEIYRLLRELTSAPLDDRRDALILQQELTKRLALLEQLEMQLARGTREQRTGTVRSAVAEPVPAEYKDTVAEYYRRLSKGE